MKPFLTLTLFLFSLTGFAQVDSGFTNKAEAKNQMINGAKEGKWIEYFKIEDQFEVETSSTHAPVYRLTIYKAGNPVGIAREYYKSGKLKSITPYSNGEVNGVQKVYTEKGDLVVIDTVKDGLGVGVVRTYYKNGQVKVEYPFTKDKLLIETLLYVEELKESFYAEINGIVKRYYEDGKIKSESVYMHGDERMTKNFDENGIEIKK